MHDGCRAVSDRETGDDTDRRGDAEGDGREGRQRDEPSADPPDRSPQMWARRRDDRGGQRETDPGEDRRRSRSGHPVKETGSVADEKGAGGGRQGDREELIPEERATAVCEQGGADEDDRPDAHQRVAALPEPTEQTRQRGHERRERSLERTRALVDQQG